MTTFGFEHIPAGMKQLHQWGNWRKVLKDGQKKPSKVPYNAMSLEPCSPTDPTQWGPLENAVASWQRIPGFLNGLGFALFSGLVCIDFDNALDDAGQPYPWANDILGQLPPGYTEISDSDRGLHYFGYASVPGERQKFNLIHPVKHSVEIYDCKRFIAVTGKPWQNSTPTLANCQEAIDKLYGEWMKAVEQPAKTTFAHQPLPVLDEADEEVLEKMFASKHGKRIEALWQGSTDEHSGDDSAADLALMNHLAYWCNGNREQVERLFTRSALGQRDKWLKREDYRERTLKKALATFEAREKLPDWEPLVPLTATLPPVETFDPAWLPNSSRAWIEDNAERLQCPTDFLAVAYMVCLATIIGKNVCIRPKAFDDWQVVANLWGMIIGLPSVLKTPALKVCLKVLESLEQQANAMFKQAENDWEARRILAGEQLKAHKDKARAALNDLDGNENAILQNISATLTLTQTPPPTPKRYVVNDATVEKLGVILSENPNGVLLFRDELNGFLKTLEKPGHDADRALYLEAWNGLGRFIYDRIGRGTLEVTSLCLSILGGIQPGPLRNYLRHAMDGGEGDDGLIQRFQLAVYPDIPKTWKNIDRLPCLDSQRQAVEVLELLSKRCAADFNVQLDAHHPNGFLRFTPDAQERFNAWLTDLELELRAGEHLPSYTAHIAKFRSLIPTLALLIQLADNPDANAVGVEALDKALGWDGYLRSHAQRIYASVSCGQMDAANRLLKHIKAGALPNPFTCRDVYRKGWQELNELDTAANALNILEAHNYLQRVLLTTGGRKTELFFCNPDI